MCLRRRYLYLPTHDMQALDIFAQFFVSPLMKADSSDRELQSIESEFCLSKNSDSCRLQELWCHTCKRGENTQRRVQTVTCRPVGMFCVLPYSVVAAAVLVLPLFSSFLDNFYGYPFARACRVKVSYFSDMTPSTEVGRPADFLFYFV